MDQPLDTSHPSSQTRLLVDFGPRAGLKNVTSRPEALAARSADAVDAAMASIHNLAERVNTTVGGMIRRPRNIQVEFGIKMDAEAGALIAKTKVEAHLVVTLLWSDDEDNGNS
ncbi:CU044_2847 family protein [Virgisporangium aurantiacum]|uniref:Trypsin-co-occurring domain-containing protein n=1 Tax=Virgisporangium aurantiacum TaxID=175570 RepID=A0A8J4DYJ7_9ACTN|nr:CU044_2847 family protein [Virgisporangium aurantiacum]GIJ54999.1 hypothetical protein Vau01_025150 [Virgisporangium aurantiacum]